MKGNVTDTHIFSAFYPCVFLSDWLCFMENGKEGVEATMNHSFGETLRRLRMEQGLTQQQLADRLHIDRTGVTSWETGRRIPEVVMISPIAAALGVDTAVLMASIEDSGETPNVILIDDQPIILEGGLPTLREAMPNANVVGFTDPMEALLYFKKNVVPLVFLDIELGNINGLNLCREFLRFSPRTNVIYLTSYTEYSMDAWKTGASGYLLKPLIGSEVLQELHRLRYPVKGLL